MSELTTSQLIKIIIGVVVFVVVIGGLYFFFRNNVNDFFKNLLGTGGQEFFLGLLK